MPFIIIWVIMCVAIGAVSHNRKRGFFIGFMLSLLLSPLIGLIIVLVMKHGNEIKTYKCKFCGYTSYVYTPYCPSCFKDNNGNVVQQAANKVKPGIEAAKTVMWLIIGTVVLVGISLLVFYLRTK